MLLFFQKTSMVVIFFQADIEVSSRVRFSAGGNMKFVEEICRSHIPVIENNA